MQLHTYPLLKVEDPSGLSDADWAEKKQASALICIGRQWMFLRSFD